MADSLADADVLVAEFRGVSAEARDQRELCCVSVPTANG